MAAIFTDSLQALFPHWRLGHREITWLWLNLQSRGAASYLGNFGTRAMRDGMANCINQWGLAAEIDNQKSYMLLPEQMFNWIEKHGRQPTWLLRSVERVYTWLPTCPVDLIPRERLIALLDFWNEDKSIKQFKLHELKAAWVRQQHDDKSFSWYANTGKEKQKCQIAWQWYQEHYQPHVRFATEFSDMENILEFLDVTNFSQEEKLYHLEQIKKKFKAKQTKANRLGKTQTNISLPNTTRLQLDELARKERRTKTEVIELLIQHAHEQGMPK